jgi:molecular chaperone HtpG
LIDDADIEHQRALRRARDEVDNLWGGLLDDFAKPATLRRLVLNHDNPTVRTLVASDDDAVRRAGVQSLYVTAQLMAGEPLRPRDAAVMNEALDTLLRRAAGGTAPEEP